MNKKHQVVIVGGGDDGKFFGKQHRNALGLLPLTHQVVGLLGSSNPELCAAQAAKWGVRCYRNPQEIIDNKDGISYVVDATPQDQREDNVLPLIGAHVPVYLEKPITHTLQSGQNIVAANREVGVPVGVNNTWQYGYGPTVCKIISFDPRTGKVVAGNYIYLQDWEKEVKSGSRGFRGDKSKGHWGSGADLGLTHGGQAFHDTSGGAKVESIIAAGDTCGVDGENDYNAHFLFFLEGGRIVNVHSSQRYGTGRPNDLVAEAAFDSHIRLQWTNRCLDNAKVSIPGYGSEMTVSRESGTWDHVPIVADACEKARALFPHTPDKDPVFWDGGHGARQFPPFGHEWGMLEAIATGHWRFGNWINSWVANNQHADTLDPCGTITLEDGLRQMHWLAAAEESDKNGNTKVRLRF